MTFLLLMIVMEIIFVVWGWKLFKKTNEHIWAIGTGLWCFFLGLDINRLFNMLG